MSFVPSSWPGTAKEALSRGCSFGQCLLFLPRSSSLPSSSFPSPTFSSPTFYTILASLSLCTSLPSSLPPCSLPLSFSPLFVCCIAHTRHGAACESCCHLCERPCLSLELEFKRNRSITRAYPTDIITFKGDGNRVYCDNGI